MSGKTTFTFKSIGDVTEAPSGHSLRSVFGACSGPDGGPSSGVVSRDSRGRVWVPVCNLGICRPIRLHMKEGVTEWNK